MDFSNSPTSFVFFLFIRFTLAPCDPGAFTGHLRTNPIGGDFHAAKRASAGGLQWEASVKKGCKGCRRDWRMEKGKVAFERIAAESKKKIEKIAA